MVVISGADMSAGSMCSFLAAIGSRQPSDLAMKSVQMSVSETTAATSASPYWSQMRRKLTAASTVPHSSATRASFHQTVSTSPRSISPSASPRMTMVEACEPPLPPVPISIGMNETSSGSEAMAAS